MAMAGLSSMLGVGFVLQFITRGAGQIGAVASQMGSLIKRALGVGEALTGMQAAFMATLGAVLAFKAGMAGLKALLGTMDEFAELETQLTHLQSIAGMTDEQMGEFGDTAMRLATEYPFPAAEIAEGMKTFARAGFDAQQTMEALEPMLQGAIVGETGVAEATGGLIAALKAFGLEASESQRVMDMFARGTTQAWLEMDDFSNAISRFGATAAASNQDLSDMIAVLGTLTDTGLSATRAGTMMKMMLVKLRAPTSAATQALQSMGVEVYNQQGQVRSLIDIIEDIDEATARAGAGAQYQSTADALIDLGDLAGEQAQMIRDMFGQRAMVGYDVLTTAEQRYQGEIRTGTDLIRARRDELAESGGFATEYAENVGETWEATQQKLTNSFENIKIVIGQVVAPAVKWFAGALQKVADGINWLMREVPALVYTFVGLFALLSISALILAIGLVKLAISSALAAPSVAGLSISVSSLAAAAWAAMLPILKVIGIIILVALAIWGLIELGKLIYNNWDKITSAIADAATWLWTNIIKPIVDLYWSVMDPIVNYFISIFTSMYNQAKDFFNIFKALFSGDFGLAWEYAKSFFNRFLNQFIMFINAVIDIFNNTIGKVTGEIGRVQLLDTSTPAVGGEGEPEGAARGIYEVTKRTETRTLHEGEQVIQQNRREYSRHPAQEAVPVGPLVGNINITVEGDADPRDLERQVERAISRVMERSRK